MTITAPLWPGAARDGSPALTGDAGAGYRDGPGRLRIDPRVVQKLAARAASEVDGVSRVSAGPIGRALHHPVPTSTPHDQLAVDVDLSVSIRYPLPLSEVVERLASHVARKVEQLTSRPTRHVRVTVQGLGVPGADHPRVR